MTFHQVFAKSTFLSLGVSFAIALHSFGAEAQKNGAPSAPSELPHPLASSIQQYCIDCHDAEMKEGNLDFDRLGFDLENKLNHDQWTKVWDRVLAGEMPPQDKTQPKAEEKKIFLDQLAGALVKADHARNEKNGRATARRLNRYEYENTLRDLLGAPWLKVRDKLPEDGTVHHFNKVAEGLDISHIQMSRYMAAADEALREVMAHVMNPPKKIQQRFYARDDNSMVNKMFFSEFNRSPERATFPILGFEAQPKVRAGEAPATVGKANPELREKEAIGVVASSYEPIELRFRRFVAPISGKYRIKFNAHSVWVGPGEGKNWFRPNLDVVSKGKRSEPITFYAESPPRQVRYLKSFEFGVEPTEREMEIYLNKGEFIRWDASRLFRSRPPRFRNPLATAEGQPGVAFKWMEVDGPIYDKWPRAGHKLLFGDLKMSRKNDKAPLEIIPQDLKADSEKLMRNFLVKAYRQPYTDADLQAFLSIVHRSLESGGSFVDSMIAGYTAVLCSPKFLWVEANVGDLDKSAIASRLSYFLWNSQPDQELRKMDLKNQEVLVKQTNRLLESHKMTQFVDAFLDYWLDLRKINDTSPDADMYPDYYLDDLLQESSLIETQQFFKHLIRENLPARNLIDSDFAFLNERLAQHYALPPIQGVHVRKVNLPKESVRGGLLTQASVLKVTANGSNTSPVVRGVWVMDRMLGKPPPPPPPSVPAIEPDIRGATTIRQQLEKHREQPSCALCHTKMDPAGFALESFDVLGGFRTHYRKVDTNDKSAKPVEGIGKNGQMFTFSWGQIVDSSGQLPEGGDFKEIHGFKSLILKDERQIARNLLSQLVTYSTGAPVRFGDRQILEQILDAAKESEYGVRTLLIELIKSPIFLKK